MPEERARTIDKGLRIKLFPLSLSLGRAVVVTYPSVFLFRAYLCLERKRSFRFLASKFARNLVKKQNKRKPEEDLAKPEHRNVKEI